MTQRIDSSDTINALAHHVSGDEYIVEQASVWEDEQCVGVQIIRSCGPINRRDLGHVDGPLEPSKEIFDAISTWDGYMSEDDAAWLQAEEDDGRLAYPIGARA